MRISPPPPPIKAASGAGDAQWRMLIVNKDMLRSGVGFGGKVLERRECRV